MLKILQSIAALLFKTQSAESIQDLLLSALQRYLEQSDLVPGELEELLKKYGSIKSATRLLKHAEIDEILSRVAGFAVRSILQRLKDKDTNNA